MPDARSELVNTSKKNIQYGYFILQFYGNEASSVETYISLCKKCFFFFVFLKENWNYTDCLLSTGYKRSPLTDETEITAKTEVTIVVSNETDV